MHPVLKALFGYSAKTQTSVSEQNWNSDICWNSSLAATPKI